MSDRIPSQIPVWDSKHANGDHDILRNTPSPLAELSERYFPEHSRILELGCGVGRDAVFFAEHGHEVVATDGSGVVIEQDKKTFVATNVEFKTLDMRDALPYESASFDVVYANLSLHYYAHKKTAEIVNEVSRVLKQGGIFAFACKSYDSLHEGGMEIEENIFTSPTGQTIHIFSTDYARELLKDTFREEYVDEIDEVYNGRHSGIVRCIAKKLT